jgi:hypothetical protein
MADFTDELIEQTANFLVDTPIKLQDYLDEVFGLNAPWIIDYQHEGCRGFEQLQAIGMGCCSGCGLVKRSAQMNPRLGYGGDSYCCECHICC